MLISMREACVGVSSFECSSHTRSYLEKMTNVRLVPVESTTIQETMESLGMNFSLDPVVTKALLATKIQNLEEFRFLFEDESKVDTFLAKLQLGEDRLIQGSRLRRAWTAVTLYYKNQDQDRSKISVSDLDTMLADTELRDVKSNFWIRYRMRFPPEIHPADATLSRISRELSKRMLCVYNLWKVRTLQYQLHTTQRKRKLAEGLCTEEAEDEDKIPHDWENYLDRLLTLLVAYAMAGVTPRASVRDASLEKTLGADSTEFVEVPLDVVMHYFTEPRSNQARCHHRRGWPGLSPKTWRTGQTGLRDIVNRPSPWGRSSRRHVWPVMHIGCRMLSLERPGRKRSSQPPLLRRQRRCLPSLFWASRSMGRRWLK